MQYSSDTEKRVALYLKRMKKAMPRVQRAISAYERAVKNGTVIKSPKPAPQFRHG